MSIRFVAEHEGHASEIAVEKKKAHHYVIGIDGVSYEVDAVEFKPGHFSVLIDHQSYEVALETRVAESPQMGAYTASIRGAGVCAFGLQDALRARLLRANAGSKGTWGPKTLHAPMPGKVSKILVAVGDTVTKGTPMVIIDAMKMENELSAPADGRVQQILVREGEAVEGGLPLVALEQ